MSVLQLAQAKSHLNISGNDQDSEIQATIAAAEAVIARHCGPLTSTSVTARVTGFGGSLVLPTTPAISLTSITPVNGSAITLSGVYLDTTSGVVTYNSGAWFPMRLYDVVYNAGRTTVPDDLLMAVKELVRHMWQTQRGPTRRPGSNAEAPGVVPGAAHMLPFRVSELIAPHMQPVIA